MTCFKYTLKSIRTWHVRVAYKLFICVDKVHSVTFLTLPVHCCMCVISLCTTVLPAHLGSLSNYISNCQIYFPLLLLPCSGGTV